MSTENGNQRLIDAESKLSQALQRLHALRRAALYGNYDPAEFDRAVMAYREAESEVQQAREAYARSQVAQVTPEREFVAVGPQAPLTVTKRMEFARWLVETGRLSDWN
ncbi:MAG: hypothetical protein HY332_12915 [Chloroflexi bacterium]|nr:hypothetical protein [Chloroflexota bacterium]